MFGKGSIKNRESEEEMHYNRFRRQQAIDLFTHDLKENHFSGLIFDQSEKVERQYQNTIDNAKDDDFYDCYIQLEAESRDDKLLALSEMNIVYVYKEFEINLKRLLKIAYNENGQKNFQWKNLVSFFKSKGIAIEKIKGADQVNELRKLNNHIKHSNTREVSDKIINIEEFKGEKHIDSDDINVFYQRIKDFPLTFLANLSFEILSTINNIE